MSLHHAVAAAAVLAAIGAGLRKAEELPAEEEESATDVNLNYMSL